MDSFGWAIATKAMGDQIPEKCMKFGLVNVIWAIYNDLSRRGLVTPNGGEK